MTELIPPQSDDQVRAYLDGLGLDGMIDLHVHFMPERVQQKVWGVFDRLPDMGEPAWPVHYRYSEEQRVQILREIGVTRFSTLNYAHRPGMATWLNEYSTDFAARYDDAIHSATFFPEDGVADYVDKVLDDGAQIFKIHIQVGAFSALDPQLAPAWQRIAAARVPVVMHCGSGPHAGEFTGPEPIIELVDRHPDLVLVIAHAGLPEYEQFAELAHRAPNVYLDTTMVGTPYMNAIAPLPDNYLETMAELEDKVVLGTDFPTIPYSYSHQLEVLHNWGLGAAWMRNVLWHNPKRLLAAKQR